MTTHKPRIRRPQTADTRFDAIFIAQFGFTIFILLAVLSMRSPTRARQLSLDRLPSDRPTPTATPDWWHALEFAQKALPVLPSLPAVTLDTSRGHGGGFAPNQPLPFETLTCPLDKVRIASIVTGTKPGWWHITGTANIADFWYWKGELSSDGPFGAAQDKRHWTTLHSGQTPVSNGILIEFLTTTVPKGSYQLRLMAVDRTGNYPEPCVVQVVIS